MHLLLLADVGTTLLDATLLVPAYNTGLMRPFETKNLPMAVIDVDGAVG